MAAFSGKKSIFYNLEYWNYLLVRHQLDVMHIEKNVCESIYGTLLHIPGKTKDGLKSKKDLVEMGIRNELAPTLKNKVAVKVFDPQYEGAFKSFDIECDVMKRIHHRNLIKITSSYSNDDFKALVLEYMPHGSLEKCLYLNNCILNIFQRLDIMIDVASALEYLHFGYSAPIIHSDLKPSNVLLDDNMVAHLSDFGMAKPLLEEDQS
ncbi:hypothetical protein WN943_022928 [Citrus x changshan-huyou]